MRVRLLNKLNIQTIFNSIDGEVNGFHGAGELCTFIRLKGCNLYQYGGCSYCDTKYAQNPVPGNPMGIDEILEFPKLLHKITITGGEPLAQRTNLSPLVDKLLENGHRITIETNGTEPPLREIDTSFRELRYVMDYKLPSSEMENQMLERAFSSLTEKDVIKFVIGDHHDYYIARDLVVHKNWEARKVFSPFFTKNKYHGTWPTELVEMMLVDYEVLGGVQYSLQIHKILWPDAKEER